MMPKTKNALIALTLTACASTGFAQTLVFDWDHTATGWSDGGSGAMVVTNGQLTLQEACGPFQPGNVWATFRAASHSLPGSTPLPNNQTLEARVDLVGANQNDAWAGINFWWATVGAGYQFFKDQDQIALSKYYNFYTVPKIAWFFYQTNQPIKNDNVTLVFALTRIDPNLRIDIRVLDKDNNNALLFEHSVMDTPEADTVFPQGDFDVPGSPWPMISEPESLALNLQWVNAEHAPTGGVAQVTFADIRAWRYEIPQLAIQNAVMLSWPATAAQFVLESARSVTGPWTTVADPLIRTNSPEIEASVVASQSMQLFRLRFMP